MMKKVLSIIAGSGIVELPGDGCLDADTDPLDDTANVLVTDQCAEVCIGVFGLRSRRDKWDSAVGLVVKDQLEVEQAFSISA